MTSSDPILWLQQTRKLSGELLSSMGVRRVDCNGHGPALAFPYQRDGKTYAEKYRTIDKQFWSTKGATRGLYNVDDLRRLEDLPIVITEGEIDALSCMEAGYERTVSVPDGWGEKNNKIDAMIAEEQALRNSPYVVVAADSDTAGESLPRAVANLLRGHDVRYAAWPEGCKDPNDVLVQHGPVVLAKCLVEAQRIDPPGGFITGIRDLPPLSDRRVLRTGVCLFDRVVTLEIGALSVWTGISGSGKSTFLTWVAEKVTVNEGVRAGLFPFEIHSHAIRDQLSLIHTGKEFADLDEARRAHLLEDLDRRFRLVHQRFDDNIAHHLEWLESTIATLAARDGCKLIVVDPWNELEHLPVAGETMTTYINWATKRLRQLAEELEVHIALVAHPKKMAERDRAPTGYDVADSSAFFNKPSLGVTVHRRKDEYGNEWVDLLVWKVRDTRLYGFGTHTTSCAFDPEQHCYIERGAP